MDPARRDILKGLVASIFIDPGTGLLRIGDELVAVHPKSPPDDTSIQGSDPIRTQDPPTMPHPAFVEVRFRPDRLVTGDLEPLSQALKEWFERELGWTCPIIITQGCSIEVHWTDSDSEEASYLDVDVEEICVPCIVCGAGSISNCKCGEES